MMETTDNTILVVDDEKETVRLLRAYLEGAGYRVFYAYEGEQALHILRTERPGLVLLDLMLPDRDGWSITKIIRADSALRATPIIMLTARVEDTDKILGLELGADDYVTKPFNPREVLARVRAVLRRNSEDTEPTERVVHYRDLRLDPHLREVSIRGDVVDLTPIEYQLLRTLMTSVGHVFTRTELIERALDDDYASLERSLDTHVKNLRKKLEEDTRNPEYILTVYGVGYRLGRRESQ